MTEAMLACRSRLASRPSVPSMDVAAGATWLKFLPATGLNNFQLLQLTLAAVCLLHAADGAMLPAIFKALEESLEKASPETLGIVSMTEALCHSLAVLAWGVLADRGSKLILLTGTTGVWGVITFATAMTASMTALGLVRAAAGIVSAALGPLAQGMIVAVCEPEGRGRAFGYIIAAGYTGHMLGLFLAGSVSHVDAVGGWRAPFCLFAALTLCLSTLLSMMCREATSGFLSQSRIWQSLLHAKPSQASETWTCGALWLLVEELAGNLYTIMRRRSFLVLILQGAFASSGVKAMSYMAMWFQYQGFTDIGASTLISIMPLGCIFGALAAGYISDYAAQLYPDHGRIFFGMVVMLLQLVIMLLMFIPGLTARASDTNFNRFLLLMFLYGAVSVMAYTGAIRPLFTEIVPSRLVGQVIALGAAIDGSIASFAGSALVGVITQRVFGYRSTTLTVEEMPEEMRRRNSMALAQAIACVSLFSALATVMAFVLLHCTYASDRAASRLEDLQAFSKTPPSPDAIAEGEQEDGEAEAQETTSSKTEAKPKKKSESSKLQGSAGSSTASYGSV